MVIHLYTNYYVNWNNIYDKIINNSGDNIINGDLVKSISNCDKINDSNDDDVYTVRIRLPAQRLRRDR